MRRPSRTLEYSFTMPSAECASRQRIVELDRLLRRGARLRHHLVRGRIGAAQRRVGVGQAGVRQRRFRIAADRLVEVGNRRVEVSSRELTEVVATLQVRHVRIGVDTAARRAASRSGGEIASEIFCAIARPLLPGATARRAGHARRSPPTAAARSPPARAEPRSARGRPSAAPSLRRRRRRPSALRDVGHSFARALVAHHRRARDHAAEPADLGETGDQRVRHAVGEILLVRIGPRDWRAAAPRWNRSRRQRAHRATDRGSVQGSGQQRRVRGGDEPGRHPRATAALGRGLRPGNPGMPVNLPKREGDVLGRLVSLVRILLETAAEDAVQRRARRPRRSTAAAPRSGSRSSSRLRRRAETPAGPTAVRATPRRRRRCPSDDRPARHAPVLATCIPPCRARRRRRSSPSGSPSRRRDPPPTRILASPKSRILTRPSRVRNRFSGLRSRWTIPFSCAAASPRAICAAMSSACPGGSGPVSSRALSVSPSSSSETT